MHKLVLILLALCAVCLSLAPQASAVSTASDFSKAYERAKKARSDCLVFSFGDWDKYSLKVYKSAWKDIRYLNKYLDNATILCDAKTYQFPTPHQEKEMKERTAALSGLNGVLCNPSVLFIDKEGFPYALAAGKDIVADPEQFAKILGEIQKKRLLRDEILAQAMKKKGEERARLIAQASDIPGIKCDNKRFAQLVKDCDPDDKLGYYRRFTFDPWKFHYLLEEKEEDAKKALDAELYKVTGYSKEQQQILLGIRGKVIRNGSNDPEELRANYERMLAIDPESVMGKSAKAALRLYCGIGEKEEDNGRFADENKNDYLDKEDDGF